MKWAECRKATDLCAQKSDKIHSNTFGKQKNKQSNRAKCDKKLNIETEIEN